jgi:tetratricopeptide (TPR) repeat protein
MLKSRIILFAIIAASTFGMYMLPRYVVNNEETKIQSNSAVTMGTSPATQDHNHSTQIPDSLKVAFESLYVLYRNADNREKRFIFADSLAQAYKSVGKLDSSARYLEVRALDNPTRENLLLAGDGYYEAFNFAVDPSKRSGLAIKARNYFERVLDEDPTLLDVKVKIGMTYVAGSEPMTGIMMIRDVLNKEVENELAIYSLGLLAITSGQYDKALARFEKLKEIDPTNTEAHFYLGYCQFELGLMKQSKASFKKVLELTDNESLTMASKDYLERINN